MNLKNDLRARAIMAIAALHTFAKDRYDHKAENIYLDAAAHVAPWIADAMTLYRTEHALSSLSEEELHARTLVGLGLPTVHVKP